MTGAKSARLRFFSFLLVIIIKDQLTNIFRHTRKADMINVSRDLGALGTIALTKRIRSDSHRSSLGVCAHACMSREVSIHCYFNSFVFLAFTKKQYVSSICHLDYYQELIHSCSIFFCVFRESTATLSAKN